MKEQLAKYAWAEYFGDDMDFLNRYFATYYSENNLIINSEKADDEFIYMGLIISYNYQYYTNHLTMGYVTAVLTNPIFRNKGFFRVVMQKIFSELITQNYALSCLIPASEELSETYIRYGYSKCFVEKQNPDLNKSIVHHQKTYDLYKELGYDLSTLKPSTNGLLRIIDLEKVLEIYAKENPNLNITYKVIDKQIERNNKLIEIKSSEIKIINEAEVFEEITISEITYLLFKDSYMDLMFDQ